jgi:VIT1/CCC1 family predicted Fe2+/Mn2+ transporter
VSVSSQRDAEQADIARERRELAAIVAERLMAADPLAATSATSLACNRSVGAATAGGGGLGGELCGRGGAPAGADRAGPDQCPHPRDGAGALALLAVLGVIGARLGGARAGPAALRVTLGGGLAMGLTALLGQLVGATGP